MVRKTKITKRVLVARGGRQSSGPAKETTHSGTVEKETHDMNVVGEKTTPGDHFKISFEILCLFNRLPKTIETMTRNPPCMHIWIYVCIYVLGIMHYVSQKHKVWKLSVSIFQSFEVAQRHSQIIKIPTSQKIQVSKFPNFQTSKFRTSNIHRCPTFKISKYTNYILEQWYMYIYTYISGKRLMVVLWFSK